MASSPGEEMEVIAPFRGAKFRLEGEGAELSVAQGERVTITHIGPSRCLTSFQLIMNNIK